MPLVSLDDLNDPRLAPFRNVTDPDLLRSHELFVAEGRLVVRTLLTSSTLRTRSVLVTRAAAEALSDLVLSRADVPFFVVPQSTMDGIAGFNIHRGCLALGERPPPYPLESLFGADATRLVILENVSNCDNIGGIFRCVAALGGHGVVVGPQCCDPLYRKAIRTSIGASLFVPFAAAGAWPHALGRLRAAGYRLIALTPTPEARCLDDVAGELSAGDRVALLAGSEGAGLTEAALAHSDVRARIPISPAVDSLNVTVAVGIALHSLHGRSDDAMRRTLP
jgi:tRNA G18 (ribose-2'-O)-methylase SpoU